MSLEDAYENKPNSLEVMVRLAETYIRSEMYEEAFKMLTNSINIYQDSSTLYFKRGEVASILGIEKQALQDYSRAIQIDPHNVDAYLYRSLSWAHFGFFDKAYQDVLVKKKNFLLLKIK